MRTALLIDDLEDGDGGICLVEGRKGGWYTAKDNSPNGLVTPTPGMPFVPTAMTPSSAGHEVAARMAGTGLADWGATLAFNLNDDGVSYLPYNATAFGGVKLRYKSSLPVRLSFLTKSVLPQLNGGACTMNCYDSYGMDLPATFDVLETHAKFVDAKQQGFGRVPRFDNDQVMDIQFTVKSAGQAFELWVDEIWFEY